MRHFHENGLLSLLLFTKARPFSLLECATFMRPGFCLSFVVPMFLYPFFLSPYVFISFLSFFLKVI